MKPVWQIQILIAFVLVSYGCPAQAVLDGVYEKPGVLYKGMVMQKGSSQTLDSVAISVIGSDSLSRRVYTNSSGQFALSLPPGTYVFTYSKPNFITIIDRVMFDIAPDTILVKKDMTKRW